MDPKANQDVTRVGPARRKSDKESGPSEVKAEQVKEDQRWSKEDLQLLPSRNEKMCDC